MAVGMLKVLALIFQRMARLIFYLPPRPATAQQGIAVACAPPQVGHPPAVLPLLSTPCPVRKKVDPHVRMRVMEKHSIHKAMHETRGTIVPRIIGDASSLLGRLDLLASRGMIPFFTPQEIP